MIVPENGCPLSDSDYSLLQETIPQDVLTAISDGSYGIDTYTRVHSFVQSSIEHYKYILKFEIESVLQLQHCIKL